MCHPPSDDILVQDEQAGRARRKRAQRDHNTHERSRSPSEDDLSEARLPRRHGIALRDRDGRESLPSANQLAEMRRLRRERRSERDKRQHEEHSRHAEADRSHVSYMPFPPYSNPAGPGYPLKPRYRAIL